MHSDHSKTYSDIMEIFYNVFDVTFELKLPFLLSILFSKTLLILT